MRRPGAAADEGVARVYNSPMALRFPPLLIAALVLGVPVEAALQGDRPRTLNVLWLTVEDMSPWIGPYGDTTVPTPRLDAFAAESLRYDNAFASSPVCAPARTAILMGIDPTRMGAMHMRVRSRSKAAGDEAYAGIPLYEAVPPAFAEPFPRALRRAGWQGWRRNLAVALGNAPHSAAISRALDAARPEADALVAEHIDWALARQQPAQA